jgi:hypothetical protein
MGKPETDGSYTIKTGRPGRVYCQMLSANAQTTIVEAVNTGAPEIAGLPILLQRQKDGELYVISSDNTRATEHLGGVSPGGSGGPHSHRIGFGFADAVEGRRFEPGLVRINTGDDLTVYVEPFHYVVDGDRRYWAGGTIDLTSYVPVTADKKAWVKVGLDPSDDTLTAEAGADINVGTTPNPATIADITFTGLIQLGAVILRNGQTAINNDLEFADCREWVTSDAGLTTFTGLTDTPAAYAAGEPLRVNAGATAIEFMTDPGADRLIFWDESATLLEYLTLSADFSIAATTLSLTEDYATAALDNLAAVAVNTDIVSDTDDADDLGSSTARWAQIWGTNTFADAHAFVVKNTSGATASANDVGYIDEAGEYKTTTTAQLDAAWCVVIVGAANNSDVYVARRGRVTVAYTGAAPSTGDFLATSTSAGDSQQETAMRPEIFAVCVGNGAGGTVEALLLTGRTPIPLTDATYILNPAGGVSDSDWRTTINGAPAGAVVTYTAPLTSGAENVIDPSGPNLGKLRLYNETRATYALILSVNTGANTVTVTDAADISGWQNGDTITARSQTNTDEPTAGVVYYMDAEITSSIIPALTTKLSLEAFFLDTGGAGASGYAHPWETFGTAKELIRRTQSAEGFYASYEMPLINRRFTVAWDASGSATFFTGISIAGVVVASP